MSNKHNDEYMETVYRAREAWLSNHGVGEGDVMRDENGEYVVVENEIGTAGEDGYAIDLDKVYIPITMSLDIFDHPSQG